jgi:hypothetical protein
MRACMAILGVALAACSGRMEPGPIGQPLDLRQYLPDSLRLGTPGVVDSTYRHQISVGPDSARVELSWTAFQHGSGRYLATIAARLLAEARYDSLKLVDPSDLQNSGSKWEADESAKVRVVWFKKGPLGVKSGAVKFWFSATGKRLFGLPDSR